jgi:glyoxylase-like metal-dependent hydrolase (beta-lactamase superfamily II)
MELGRFTVESLSEGQFVIHPDGSIEKPVWSTSMPADPAEPSGELVGIDPMLVLTGRHVVLLDAGIGLGLDAGSPAPGVSNLKTNLDIFGMKAEDVTHVVLSHLHYDHAAGLSYTDEASRTVSTLPNARIVVQQAEWDFAIAQLESPSPQLDTGYQLDDLLRLKASGQLHCIRQDSLELVPGITLIRTGGHTPGHQIVRIADSGQSAYFLGDLIPTEDTVHSRVRRDADIDPEHAARMRLHMLRQIYRERAYILFYHSLFSRMVRIIRHPMGSFGLKED